MKFIIACAVIALAGQVLCEGPYAPAVKPYPPKVIAKVIPPPPKPHMVYGVPEVKIQKPVIVEKPVLVEAPKLLPVTKKVVVVKPQPVYGPPEVKIVKPYPAPAPKVEKPVPVYGPPKVKVVKPYPAPAPKIEKPVPVYGPPKVKAEKPYPAPVPKIEKPVPVYGPPTTVKPKVKVIVPQAIYGPPTTAKPVPVVRITVPPKPAVVYGPPATPKPVPAVRVTVPPKPAAVYGPPAKVIVPHKVYGIPQGPAAPAILVPSGHNLPPTPPKVDITTSVLEALTSGEKYYPAHTAGPKVNGEAIPDLLSTSSVSFRPGSSGHKRTVPQLIGSPLTQVHYVAAPSADVVESKPYPPASYPYPAKKVVPVTTAKPKVTYPYPPAVKKVTLPYPPAAKKVVVTTPKPAPYPPKTYPYPAAA